MKSSLVGSLLLVIFAIFLILRINKGANSQKYKKRPKNKWQLLSEGKDPTDDSI